MPAVVRVHELRVQHGLQHGERKRLHGVEHQADDPLGTAVAGTSCLHMRLRTQHSSCMARCQPYRHAPAAW
jgi:hypothetical protein